MRYIKKESSPDFFENWKNNQKEAGIELTYNSFQNPQKAELSKHLWKEQHGLCCYCEKKLEVGINHIEHLLPQSSFKDKQLDYSNLLCSCGIQKHNMETPSHCGFHKENEILQITPLQDDCSTFFAYTSDGKIEPNDNNEDASLAIDILNLNDPRLVASRKMAFTFFITSENKTALLEDNSTEFFSFIHFINKKFLTSSSNT